MAQAAPKPWTVDEFLEWERTQEERYEFIDGVIRMMVGGTADHNIIALKIASTLQAGLRGRPCRAFMENMKVESGGLVMYPDVVATCAEVPRKGDTVPEPLVVVEVLSRSTEGADRGAKWDAYQRIPSLAQYVLVAQDKLRVEVYTRRDDRWDYRAITDPRALVTFAPFGIDLALADIYEGTSLDPSAAASPAP